MKRALTRLCAFILFCVLTEGILRFLAELGLFDSWSGALVLLLGQTVFDGPHCVLGFALAALLSFLLDLLAIRLRRLAYRIVLDSAVLGALAYLAVACGRSGMGDGIGGALLGCLIGHYVMLLGAFRLGVHVVTWRTDSRDKAIGDIGEDL